MDSKYSEEAYDIFYLEIEERIMLVISDEEDEEPTRKNRAPLLTICGKNPQFFQKSNSFLDVNWYGSFDLRMKQRQTYFESGNWEKSALEKYETSSKARGRRVPVANERKGTGVFIPRSA